MNEKTSLRLDAVLNRPTTHFNLVAAQLVEAAVRRGEGKLSATGAFSTSTGKYTGRSPKDKFVVQDEVTADTVAWGSVNVPFSEEQFAALYSMVLDYLEGLDEFFVFDGYVGADPEHQMSLRVINQYAWQNLFARQLFIRPTREALQDHKPNFTVIAVPGLTAVPERDGTNSEAFVIVSFKERVVLIGGTGYAGEIKKSIFSVMNYLLPQGEVLPMHCSANVGQDGRTALFFGLSGTGKTTLSADPGRQLVGDDEHGWSERGIFNLEGGCYAKCINLSREHEPQIWDAIKFGSVLENFVLYSDERIADYNDDPHRKHPLCLSPGLYSRRVDPSLAGHPSAVVFLTADAFEYCHPSAFWKMSRSCITLSPVIRVNWLVQSGDSASEATFSACFGEPFLPLSPLVYAQMLKDRVNQYGAKVYLINTGWSGGPFGVGERISLKYTRQMVTSVLSGALDGVDTRLDPVFGFKVPTHCPGVPDPILDPKQTWKDPKAYDAKAQELAQAFHDNFKAKYADLAPEVRKAGPVVK